MMKTRAEIQFNRLNGMNGTTSVPKSVCHYDCGKESSTSFSSFLTSLLYKGEQGIHCSKCQSKIVPS